MSWAVWRGAEAKKLADKAERAALRTVGRRIMAEAKKQVPHDSGALESSGKVVRSRAKIPTVKLVFGGKAAPYAVKWHERAAHFRGGRKRRYLADPFNEIAWNAVRREMLAEFGRALS